MSSPDERLEAFINKTILELKTREQAAGGHIVTPEATFKAIADIAETQIREFIDEKGILDRHRQFEGT